MQLKLLNYKLSKKEIRQNYFNGNIEFKSCSRLLIKSILSNLSNSFVDDSYNNIFFKCSSMSLFTDCYKTLTTTHILKMIFDISNQMKYLLEKYKCVFVGFDPRHILVINGNKFVYIFGDHLQKIDNNENIDITFLPNAEDIILAPELYELNTIPCKINYKCSYFSVGILFLFIYKIIELNDYKQINTRDTEEIDNLLDTLSLKNTKMFYFLKRCLHKNPTKRTILFI